MHFSTVDTVPRVQCHILCLLTKIEKCISWFFSLTKGQCSKRQTILSVLAVHRPFYISICISIYILLALAVQGNHEIFSCQGLFSLQDSSNVAVAVKTCKDEDEAERFLEEACKYERTKVVQGGADLKARLHQRFLWRFFSF